MQLTHLGTFLSQRDGQVVQLLLRPFRGVHDLSPVSYGSAADLEQGEAPYVRFRGRLEDQCGEGLIVRYDQSHRVASPRWGGGFRHRLGRVRKEIDDPVEELPTAEAALGGSQHHGHDLVRPYAHGQRLDCFVLGDLAALQIFLEQILVEGGERLLELGLPLLYLSRDLVGNLAFVELALVSRLEDVRSILQKVRDAREALAGPDRDLDGDRLRGQPRPDVGQHAGEVGMLLVHHRDDQDPRNTPGLAVLPDLLRPHLDTRGGAQEDDGGIGGADGRERVAREVQIARGIEQVDLVIPPIREGRSQLHRDAMRDLLRAGHRQGVSILDVSLAAGGARRETEGVDQSRLA